MALQTSGEITLQDIAYEFDDAAPHELTEFYGAATGIPTSGEITISDFYGTSAAFYNGVLDNGSLFLDGGNNAYAYRSTRPTAQDQTKGTWSFWWKRASSDYGTGEGEFFLHNINNSSNLGFRIGYGDGVEGRLYVGANTGGGFYGIQTSRQCRDQSGWMHIVVVWDSGNATSTERVRLYINGERETAVSANFNGYPTTNLGHRFSNQDGNWEIGDQGYTGGGSRRKMRSYICDYHFVDGQTLNPTSFGELKNGVWIPKAYTGSYGTAGFHLPLTSNTNDTSGNGHHFTASGISSHDYKLDSPENNFAVMNPNHEPDGFGAYVGLEEGNLKLSNPSNWVPHVYATIGVTSGKWYWEMYANDCDGTACWYGLTLDGKRYGDANHGKWRSNGANHSGSGFTVSNGISISNGNVIGFALDADNGTLYFYLNGVGKSAAVTYTPSTQGTVYPAFQWDNSGTGRRATFNFGQDSTFAGATTAGGNSDGNGYGDFKYSVPSGYLALCTANLPVATAVDPFAGNSPQDHFAAVLYSYSSASSTSITGVGFQPDATWIKGRNAGSDHYLVDAVRGTSKALAPGYSTAEFTETNGITSFDSDGFTIGTGVGYVNYPGRNYVAWNWKANGSGVSNTSGSITSTVSANTGAGISIVNWTYSSSNSTVGHGLNQVPDMWIVKPRNQNLDWLVWHKDIGAASSGYYLRFNTDAGTNSSGSVWGGVNPTSSTFGQGSGIAYNGDACIAYVFAEIDGFSKFSSYRGNSSSDGTFVYTGFRPAYVMVKETSGGNNWWIVDDGREPYNVMNQRLAGDLANSESSDINIMDFVSNGFKLRDSNWGWNDSGRTYVYMAFAENPFKYANAR